MSSNSEIELERMLGGILFDLHPNVGNIKAAAEILLQDFGADLSPDAQKCLSAIQQSARRMDEVLQNLRDYLSKRAGVSPDTPC